MKRFAIIIVAALLTALLPAVAFAANGMPSWYPSNPETFQDFHGTDLPRVVDDADILTADEEQQLTQKLAQMKDKYQADFVVFTDTSSHGLSRGVYAADFYTFNGYGVGDDYDGLVLFVCMEKGNRGWFTATCGSCKDVITEGNLNKLDDLLYPYMVDGKYGEGMLAFFNKMDGLFALGFFMPDPMTFGICLVIAIIVGLIAGGSNSKSKKRKMVTVEQAVEARRYVAPNGFVLSGHEDRYAGSTYVRTPRPRDDDHHRGGGGGRSSFSGGFSGSGGGHSFGGGGRSF